jgi:hypothetical protein
MAACGAGSTPVLAALLEDVRFEAELQRHAGVFHQALDLQKKKTRWSMDLRYELFLASTASQTADALEFLQAQFGRRFLTNVKFQTETKWVETGMIPPRFEIEEISADDPYAISLTANLAAVACRVGNLPGLTWLLDLKRTDNIHSLVSLNSGVIEQFLIKPLVQIAVANSQAEIVNLLMSRSGTAKALEDKIDLRGDVGFHLVGLCLQTGTHAVMKALLKQSWSSLSTSGRDENTVREEGNNRHPSRPDWIDIPALLRLWGDVFEWPFNFTSSSSNDNPMQHLLLVHKAQLKARGLTLPVFVGSFRERAFLNACSQGAVWALDIFMDEVDFNPRGCKNTCVEVIMEAYLIASDQLVALADLETKGEEVVIPPIVTYNGFRSVATSSVIEALPSREQQMLAQKQYQTDLLATLEILLLDTQTPEEQRVRLLKKIMRTSTSYNGLGFGKWMHLHPYRGPLLRLLTSPRRKVHREWISEWRKMIEVSEELESVKMDEQVLLNSHEQAVRDTNNRWLQLMRTKQMNVAKKASEEDKAQQS